MGQESHRGLRRGRLLKCPAAGWVTPADARCSVLPNSHAWRWADLSGILKPWRLVIKAISCPPQNIGKALENVKLLLHMGMRAFRIIIPIGKKSERLS